MTERTVIRDAIWGDIGLGARELSLVDTAAFQRLRRVRQLGFTYLVFPGAHHTRFEHSLGVYHTAGLALARLVALDEAPSLSRTDHATFLAAALLHDVGHYPFSHALEELEVEAIRSHTDVARDVIGHGEVATVLRESWEVDPARVSLLVAGPRGGDEPSSDVDGLLRSLLDSGLDIDKLDYLVRDASGANVPYGVVDVQRLVGALTVWREVEGGLRLAVEEKGIAALQSLVFAKHLMFATVYWHHACRSAVAMLHRAVQAGLEAGAMTAHDLEGSDDASLVTRLSAPEMPSLTRDLAGRLHDRRLYKRSVELQVDDERFGPLERLWFRPSERSELEDSWASAVGVAAGSVLLDIPEPKRITVDLPVIVGGGSATDWDHVSGLATSDLERFQRWVRKIRVFAADAPTADRLREAWRRLAPA